GHTLYRPRDLMLIGGKIAEIPAVDRTQERLRAAVDQAASEIVRHYLDEMRGCAHVPDRLLFRLTPSNTRARSDLTRVAKAYADRMKAKQPDGVDPHPSCAVYGLGLLGVVRRSREQKDVKIFRQPHDLEHAEPKLALPAERLYLIHPALDDTIA